MLAGRPHEAAGNGSPRWMAAGPREPVHRTRPTGQLARRLTWADTSHRGIAVLLFLRLWQLRVWPNLGSGHSPDIQIAEDTVDVEIRYL